jgi:hypothetical protein
MKLLRSKTASKAGASLWIPAGRGRPEKLAKIRKALRMRSVSPGRQVRKIRVAGSQPAGETVAMLRRTAGVP